MWFSQKISYHLQSKLVADMLLLMMMMMMMMMIAAALPLQVPHLQ
jgi:hypothetical protein